MSTEAKFSDLLGRTLVRVEDVKGEEIHFTCDNGEVFKLYHDQDCCESVGVEDVIGNLDDLVGSPITMADEAASAERPSDLPPAEFEEDSQTWTFYKLATVKGYVTIRFLGTSNGYYSESVDFARIAGASHAV